jgi:Ca2+/Na+ antiporter
MGKASKWLLRSVIVLLLVLLTLMSWCLVSSFQNFANFQFMEWDTLVIYGLYFIALFYSLKKDRRNDAAL